MYINIYYLHILEPECAAKTCDYIIGRSTDDCSVALLLPALYVLGVDWLAAPPAIQVQQKDCCCKKGLCDVSDSEDVPESYWTFCTHCVCTRCLQPIAVTSINELRGILMICSFVSLAESLPLRVLMRIPQRSILRITTFAASSGPRACWQSQIAWRFCSVGV